MSLTQPNVNNVSQHEAIANRATVRLRAQWWGTTCQINLEHCGWCLSSKAGGTVRQAYVGGRFGRIHCMVIYNCPITTRRLQQQLNTGADISGQKDAHAWVYFPVNKRGANCAERVLVLTTFRTSHDISERLKRIVTLTLLFSSRISRNLVKPQRTTCLRLPLMSARTDWRGEWQRERQT